MRLRKITAIMIAVLMIVSVVCVPTVSAATNPYETKAHELDQKAYTGSDLGSTYTPSQTTFKLWAPTASAVKVNLYATGSDNEEGAKALGSYDMTYTDTIGLWSTSIAQDLKNVYYTYSVTVGTKTNEVVDIYAKAVGVNGNRGMVVDLDSTDPEGWSSDTHVLTQSQSDASIWEIHVKDFSNSETSGVSEANRGKYLAFTENGTTVNGDGNVSTCIDYLKDLGITHVQINPFFDYASVDETGDGSQFNWGYDPKNYNAPEGSYSSNPYDGNVRINEVKQMIEALHKAGIGVIMDVVYNHTYSNVGSWFEKTVPDYYYRKAANGTWSNASGCGNDTASERAMYRKFMIESVTYWASEYHIDGFRFDLMGLHDTETMNQIRASLDNLDPRIIMYGEGWDMASKFDTGTVACSQKNASQVSERIGFFNDGIRDGLKGSVFNATEKGFVQGSYGKMAAVKAGMMANLAGTGGGWSASAPTQTVSYASCHDNATLYDRLVSSCIGTDKSMYGQRYDDLVQMNKLNAGVLFASQGSVFMLAGEEMARTKLGDTNSYVSAPSINQIDWTNVEKYSDLVSYYAGMNDIRKTYAPFRASTADVFKNYVGYNNSVPSGVIDITYENVPGAVWNTVAILANNNTEPKTATVKTKSGNVPTKWVVLANDQAAGLTSLGEVSGSDITIPARSAYILVDKASYDASGVKSSRGMVKINHINEKTGEIIKTSTSTGTIGKYYSTGIDSSLAIDYDYDRAEGNTTGHYTAETQTVNYYYTPFEIKARDINNDGKINLKDASLMQKYVVDKATLTAAQLKLGDMNGDGKVNSHDINLFLRSLNEEEIPSFCNVTASYLDEATNKEIATAVTTRYRIGSDYTTDAKAVNYYELDSTKLPTNASGKCTQAAIDVNYYYNFKASTMTVHVKLKDGQTWTPNLYVWEDGNTTVTGAWPGTKMTQDSDGWWTLSFACGGKYNWIVNDGGSNQTIDNMDVSSDIWVVMNVAKPNKGTSDYTVYTSKP